VVAPGDTNPIFSPSNAQSPTSHVANGEANAQSPTSQVTNGETNAQSPTSKVTDEILAECEAAGIPFLTLPAL
jgi:hypothetical protein